MPRRAPKAQVVGDVLRRLPGPSAALRAAPASRLHAIPATQASPPTTVLSVDAVRAFDHVARGSMLDALHGNP